jgi:hypothetical protein
MAVGYIDQLADDLFEIRGNQVQIDGIVSRQKRGRDAIQKRWQEHKKLAEQYSGYSPSIQNECGAIRGVSPLLSSSSFSVLPNGSAKCAVASAIAPPSVTNKKFFAPDSEIPHSDPHDSESYPSEGSNPAAVESLEGDLCRGSQLDSKPGSVDDSPVKIDLPIAAEKPKRKREPKAVKPEDAAARSATRAAFIECFRTRYGSDPILAAKENTQIKNLVSAVGQQDAPFLVKFYLDCQDDFLVNKCHPIGILAANPTEYVIRMKKGQTDGPAPRFGFGAKRPDARLVHQCMPEPDDGDDMLPWEREEFEAAKKKQEATA